MMFFDIHTDPTMMPEKLLPEFCITFVIMGRFQEESAAMEEKAIFYLCVGQ